MKVARLTNIFLKKISSIYRHHQIPLFNTTRFPPSRPTHSIFVRFARPSLSIIPWTKDEHSCRRIKNTNSSLLFKVSQNEKQDELYPSDRSFFFFFFPPPLPFLHPVSSFTVARPRLSKR